MLTVGCSARVAATVQRRVWELSKSRLETESSRIGQNDAMRGLKKFASTSRRSFPARRRRPTGQQEEALRRGAKSALMTIRDAEHEANVPIKELREGVRAMGLGKHKAERAE